jgi:hypothetical protein
MGQQPLVDLTLYWWPALEAFVDRAAGHADVRLVGPSELAVTSRAGPPPHHPMVSTAGCCRTWPVRDELCAWVRIVAVAPRTRAAEAGAGSAAGAAPVRPRFGLDRSRLDPWGLRGSQLRRILDVTWPYQRGQRGPRPRGRTCFGQGHRWS